MGSLHASCSISLRKPMDPYIMLILVRHSETQHTVEQRYSGHADPQLTAKGHRQAAEVAKALCDVCPQAIYSSDLSRACETAQVIADVHGMAFSRRPALREQYFGRLTGKRLRVLVESRVDAAADRYLGTSCRYAPVELRASAPLCGELVDVTAGRVEDGRIHAA